MTKHKLERHREFDIDSAEERVWYTLHEYKEVGLFKKRMEWKPVKVYVFDFGGGSKEPARGNYKWAQRIAKELKIDVPK